MAVIPLAVAGPADVNLGMEEHLGILYVKAWQEKAVLSLDQNLSLVSEHKIISLDPNSAQSLPDTWVGGPPVGPKHPFVNLPLVGSFPEPWYLNVTAPVEVQVVWRMAPAGSLQPAPPGAIFPGLNTARIRFEVWTEDEGKEPLRVGGFETFATGNSAASPWSTASGQFRAETASLTGNRPITLRVTLVDGLGDVWAKTHESVPYPCACSNPSYIQFRYFTEDPLSNTLYFKNGVLSRAAPATEATAPVGALGFLGVPLARLGFAPKRNLRFLVAGLVASGMLAGCAGNDPSVSDVAGSNDDGPQSKTRISIVTEQDPAAMENGSGRTRWVGSLGVIAENGDEAGAPIPKALVSLLGTNRYGVTNASGRILFSELTPALYRIRVAPPSFDPVEADAAVLANRTTIATVQFTLATSSESGLRAHSHDDWLGKTSEVIFHDTIRVGGTRQAFLGGDVVQEDTNGAWSCGQNMYYKWVQCRWPIPIPAGLGHYVYPGTGEIRIDATWNDGPKELALAFVTPQEPATSPEYLAGRNLLAPRSSGDPFRLAIFPHEADLGHQKYTRWAFFISPPETGNFPPHAPFVYPNPVNVDVKITIKKGVVPLEPPHPDLWGDADELTVLKTTRTFSSLPGTILVARLPGDVAWDMDIVPAGTSNLRGFFYWEAKTCWTAGATVACPNLTTWGLSYRSPVAADWENAELVESAPGTGLFQFVVPLKDHEADPPYSAPRWRFAVRDGCDQPYPGWCRATDSYQPPFWWLNVTAVRDPAFSRESFK